MIIGPRRWIWDVALWIHKRSFLVLIFWHLQLVSLIVSKKFLMENTPSLIIIFSFLLIKKRIGEENWKQTWFIALKSSLGHSPTIFLLQIQVWFLTWGFIALIWAIISLFLSWDSSGLLGASTVASFETRNMARWVSNAIKERRHKQMIVELQKFRHWTIAYLQEEFSNHFSKS